MTRGVGARGDGLAELVKHQLHGGGVDLGQDQGDAGVALRADGAEQVDGLVTEVAATPRADALLIPAPTQSAGLTDPVESVAFDHQGTRPRGARPRAWPL